MYLQARVCLKAFSCLLICSYIAPQNDNSSCIFLIFEFKNKFFFYTTSYGPTFLDLSYFEEFHQFLNTFIELLAALFIELLYTSPTVIIQQRQKNNTNKGFVKQACEKK